MEGNEAYRPAAEALIDATRAKPIDEKVNILAEALRVQFAEGMQVRIDPSEIAVGLTSAAARFIGLALRDQNSDAAFFRGLAALTGAIDGLEGFGRLAGSDTGAEGILTVLRELRECVQNRDHDAVMVALDRRLSARQARRDREQSAPMPPTDLQRRPHPIDTAVAALSELAAELLTGGKPSRFVELQRLTGIAMQVQQLRPMAGIDDFHGGDAHRMAMGGGMMPMPQLVGGGLGDIGDINREMIMLIQGFLEAEKGKRGAVARGREAGELSTLTDLRLQLTEAGERVPAEITRRINYLIQRIGEPDELDPSLHPVAVRGRPADGAGQPDGDRVGEAVPE